MEQCQNIFRKTMLLLQRKSVIPSPELLPLLQLLLVLLLLLLLLSPMLLLLALLQQPPLVMRVAMVSTLALQLNIIIHHVLLTLLHTILYLFHASHTHYSY